MFFITITRTSKKTNLGVIWLYGGISAKSLPMSQKTKKINKRHPFQFVGGPQVEMNGTYKAIVYHLMGGTPYCHPQVEMNGTYKAI